MYVYSAACIVRTPIQFHYLKPAYLHVQVPVSILPSARTMARLGTGFACLHLSQVPFGSRFHLEAGSRLVYKTLISHLVTVNGLSLSFRLFPLLVSMAYPRKGLMSYSNIIMESLMMSVQVWGYTHRNLHSGINCHTLLPWSWTFRYNHNLCSGFKGGYNSWQFLFRSTFHHCLQLRLSWMQPSDKGPGSAVWRDMSNDFNNSAEMLFPVQRIDLGCTETIWSLPV